MKEDLEKQIEEKKRLKEEQKQRDLHLEKLEDERIKREAEQLPFNQEDPCTFSQS